MKTAYELAMERLNKSSPMTKLSAAQKKQISELESLYKSRIAEREIGAGDEIARAESAGNYAAAEERKSELAREIKKLEQELEDKKEQVRQGRN